MSTTDSSDNEDETRPAAASAMLLFLLAHEAVLVARSAAIARQRLKWQRRVEQLEAEGSFDRTYRMSLDSFNTLLSYLYNDLAVNNAMSTRSSGVGPIEPEIVLHCTLRWLAGGSYIDIRDAAEISVASFYRVLHVGIRAVVKSDHLRYHFPSSLDEIEAEAAGFGSHSLFGVLNGCVGCLDGILVRVRTPSTTETRNARAYFSGHYQTIGVNVQAVCDHLCRFNYLCVAAPGGTNDVRAYGKTSLKRLVEDLPVGKYVIADNAYVPSEHLLTPFSGTNRCVPEHDAYNFYISQLRIKIEQAFGLMTTKWRVLRRPLLIKLSNVGNVVMAVSRLHNFVISQRPNAVNSDAVDPMTSSGSDAIGFIPSDETINVAGVSFLRDRIVRHIRSNALVRPQYNQVRNR
jgi:hypothetical protein